MIEKSKVKFHARPHRIYYETESVIFLCRLEWLHTKMNIKQYYWEDFLKIFGPDPRHPFSNRSIIYNRMEEELCPNCFKEAGILSTKALIQEIEEHARELKEMIENE